MKFHIFGKVLETKYLGTIDAPDAETARQMAEDEHTEAPVCHQCSDDVVDSMIVEIMTVEAEE